MMEVTFDVTNLTMWMDDIAAKYHTTVTVQDCIPWRGESGQSLVHVPCSLPKELVGDLCAHPGISNVDVEVYDGEVVGTLVIKECRIIRWILSAGCFLECAKADGDGKVQFKVLAGNDGSIPELIKQLKAAGMLLDIKRLKRYDDVILTTKRQRDMVRTALEKGYYDYPCRVTVKQLAEQFQISESTMRETLRRAHRNILMEYFGERKE
ncbi:MAG: helix-turn-helix domain-containing protein [Methanomassiliicoccales archaeon]